jgi:dihydrolipoamide dehydrogenase
MVVLECDVAIIGAGTAGLAAERAARKAGAKTLLIDEHFAGTTCAAVGCMPSKLLIAAANAVHNARRISTFGIMATEPIVDGSAVMGRLREERDAFVSATLKSISDIPPEIRVPQRARFINDTTLRLDDGRHVAARAFVVATGSRPSMPKMFNGFERYIFTNENLFEMSTLPRSMAVVGAGPLGLELAQALARLGVETEVFEQKKNLPAVPDAEIAKAVISELSADLPIHLGVKLVARSEEKGVHISWSGTSTGNRKFDRILVAAGRPPELGDLNLAATGVATDRRGTPHFDNSTMQCGDSSIFLAGDVDGERAVLHEALFEGAIAGKNAAAFPNVRRHSRTVPVSIVFIDPLLAMIGEPASEGTVVGTSSYAEQGRAKVEARNAGLVRIIADRETGAVRGAVLFGPGMDHIAHLFAWAIERGETAVQMLRLPFYHPTFEEGLKPALREICEEVMAHEVASFDEVVPSGA